MKSYDIDTIKNLDDIQVIARYFLENWNTLKAEGQLDKLLVKYLNKVIEVEK